MPDRIDELLAEGQRIAANVERVGPFDMLTRNANERMKQIQYELRCELAGDPQ